MSEEYIKIKKEVRKISGYININENEKYLVTWKGLTEEYDEWVNADSIPDRDISR